MTVPGPVVFVLLVGLAAGSWWLATRNADQPAAANAHAADEPSYYLRDAVLEETDSSGRLTLQVRAGRARQGAAQGAVQLGDLEVHYFPEPGQDWLLTSDKGALPPAGRIVLLEGDVRLRAAAAAEATGAVVRTEHMQLDLDSNLATTSDPVRIEFAPHVVAARGLRADLKHETLRLESSVNGTFTR